jgi:hypothetical protein
VTDLSKKPLTKKGRPRAHAGKKEIEGIRDEKGRIKKGVNGMAVYRRLNNETHSAHLRRLARVHTPECIACLVQIVTDSRRNDSARVKAATLLLERGYGKTTQVIERIDTNRALNELSTDDLLKHLETLEAKATVNKAVVSKQLAEPEIIDG